MILNNLKSRYRRFKYRNQYVHPTLVLTVNVLFHGSVLLLFLGLIAAIVLAV
jgi:hypothetical protein